MNRLLLNIKSGSLVVIAFSLIAGSCAPKITEHGRASFYADSFQGKPTASGQLFRQNRKTAAHKTLPFGTKVKVTNLKNGKTVKVTINDRGPFIAGRIIDLSKEAAAKIDMKKDGVAEVKIKYKKRRK